MFGGVDLFEQSSQGAEPVQTAEAPPTQPKASARPEKLSQSGGGGGLFDGGEEGDDDDIFNFQPATKKNKWALYRINTCM